MRQRILDILRKASEPVSGEAVSATLGVSRVSVWKHVRKLREMGYAIEATPKGYRLGEPDPDLLTQWEVPGWEGRIRHYPEVTSTMDAARELARAGCPHLTVVVADRQTAGRGRMRRTWASGDGGLYFTMVLRPELPPQHAHRLTFRAGWALARALREDFAIPAALKWPNDLLVEGRKLSGMLSEMETHADMVSFVNLGIGVNVNNDPDPEAPEAVSIRTLSGRPVPRKRVLARFLDVFAAGLTPDGLENAVTQWKQYALTLGRQVRVVTLRGVEEGKAVDVDPEGALILETASGDLRRVVHGDCFHADGTRS